MWPPLYWTVAVDDVRDLEPEWAVWAAAATVAAAAAAGAWVALNYGGRRASGLAALAGAAVGVAIGLAPREGDEDGDEPPHQTLVAWAAIGAVAAAYARSGVRHPKPVGGGPAGGGGAVGGGRPHVGRRGRPARLFQAGRRGAAPVGGV